MSLWDDLAKVHADVARQNAEEYKRWWDSLTPAERKEKTDAELAFLRRWDGMTADQKARHLHRQLTGQL